MQIQRLFGLSQDKSLGGPNKSGPLVQSLFLSVLRLQKAQMEFGEEQPTELSTISPSHSNHQSQNNHEIHLEFWKGTFYLVIQTNATLSGLKRVCMYKRSTVPDIRVHKFLSKLNMTYTFTGDVFITFVLHISVYLPALGIGHSFGETILRLSTPPIFLFTALSQASRGYSYILKQSKK